MAVKTTRTIYRIPDKDASDAAWLEWHKELKRQLGRKNANSIWIYAWDKCGKGGSNFFGSGAGKFLRNYLEQNGVEVPNAGDGIQFLSDIDQSVKGFVGNVFDSAEGLFQMGKVGVIVVGASVLGIALLLLFNIARNPIGSAKAGTDLFLATKGMKI